jgi:predicted secreted protein
MPFRTSDIQLTAYLMALDDGLTAIEGPRDRRTFHFDRKLGVSEQTFDRWKRRFAGMGVAELRRLRQLEEENRKLK